MNSAIEISKTARIDSASVQERIELIAEMRSKTFDDARPQATSKQHGLGKLTARERIAYLVDEGSFTEFGGLVAPGQAQAGSQNSPAPADGLVTGTAWVDGRPVVVASFDFTVMGGSNGVINTRKLERCRERALNDRSPLIILQDGGGHRVQEGLDSRHFASGAIGFQQMCDLSGLVPVVTAILGPGFAAPTNIAALCDFVVMVRGLSTMGIAGPAIVEAATGEKLTKEQIGGADVQTSNGLADLATDTEHEALDALRVYLSYLPSHAQAAPLHMPGPYEVAPIAKRVNNLVPTDSRHAYDVRDVIESIADLDSICEIKPMHARNIVTSLVRIGGRPVGVVANQPMFLGGAMDSPACEKAAHFIALCDAYGIALLFLVDVPGFLAGAGAESTQLGRRSGRLLYELGIATVPRFTVVLRKGYGGGYFAMGGGRSFGADLCVAWPTAEICAMPIEGAIEVAYRRDIDASADPSARRAELLAAFRRNVSPLSAADGFGIDDVIEPAATRDVLLSALSRVQLRRPPRVPGKLRSISPI
jgi:acetyl-CoA carboxylase carboxyltransferase component